MIKLFKALLGKKIIVMARKSMSQHTKHNILPNKNFRLKFTNKGKDNKKGKLSEAYIDKLLEKSEPSIQKEINQLIDEIRLKLKEIFSLECDVITGLNDTIISEIFFGECSEFKKNKITGYSKTHGAQRTIMKCNNEVLCYNDPKVEAMNKYGKI